MKIIPIDFKPNYRLKKDAPDWYRHNLVTHAHFQASIIEIQVIEKTPYDSWWYIYRSVYGMRMELLSIIKYWEEIK